jgi:oligopeptide transport system substrate-binding protein
MPDGRKHVPSSRSPRRIATLMLVIVALAGCSREPANDPPGESTTGTSPAAIVTLRRGNGPEPDSLDPQRARTDSALNVLRDVFEGLTAVGADGSPVPAAASSWDVSPDGLTYTFHLREGLHWSNGDAVVAQDFVNGMRRLVDPATASQYAQMLDPVVAAAEIVKGSRPPSELGVSAPDPRTVVLELATPTPYVLGLVAHPSTFPVHRSMLGDGATEAARPGRLVSNGAFVLEDWVIGSHIAARRNTLYWNDAANAIDAVRYVHHADPSTEFRQYRADQLDTTYVVPGQEFGWINTNLPGELHISPQLTTYYYGFNLTRPPFKDQPGLRRALSLAIDRDKLTSAVTGLGEAPAYGWVARGVANYTPQTFDYASWSYADRLREARSLYAAAGYSDSKPLEVELRYNSGESHNRIAVAVAAMWKEALGVRTKLYAEEFRALLQTIQARRETQIFRASWIGDYNDAFSFAQILQTGFGINLTGYSNPRYDALLSRAVQETDAARRRALLEEAERLMLADHPLLPLYFYVNKHLVKPHVEGWADNVMNVQYSKDLRIVRGR